MITHQTSRVNRACNVNMLSKDLYPSNNYYQIGCQINQQQQQQQHTNRPSPYSLNFNIRSALWHDIKWPPNSVLAPGMGTTTDPFGGLVWKLGVSPKNKGQNHWENDGKWYSQPWNLMKSGGFPLFLQWQTQVTSRTKIASGCSRAFSSCCRYRSTSAWPISGLSALWAGQTAVQVGSQ